MPTLKRHHQYALLLQQKEKLLAVLVEVLGSPSTSVTADDWLPQQVKLHALQLFMFAASDSYFNVQAAPQVRAKYGFNTAVHARVLPWCEGMQALKSFGHRKLCECACECVYECKCECERKCECECECEC